MYLDYVYNKAKGNNEIGVNAFCNFVELSADELNKAVEFIKDADKKDEVINAYDTINGLAKTLVKKKDNGRLYEPATGSYKVWTQFIESYCNKMTDKDNLPSVRLFFNRIGKLNRILENSLNPRF